MVRTAFVRTRLTPELKARVQAHAERLLLSESAWITGLIIRALRDEAADSTPPADVTKPTGATSGGKLWEAPSSPHDARLYVRLRNDDRLLLAARAEARGMRSATYAAVLLRSHLRNLAPLPKDELLALKRSIVELAAVGRNVNQIARVAQESGRVPGLMREDFRAMLKVCEVLRDNTKALMRSNLASWQSGHGESD